MILHKNFKENQDLLKTLTRVNYTCEYKSEKKKGKPAFIFPI